MRCEECSGNVTLVSRTKAVSTLWRVGDLSLANWYGVKVQRDVTHCYTGAKQQFASHKLGMTTEETAVYVAAQYVPDPATTRRHEQLCHWTAEAFAIVNDRTHWHILRLLRSRSFQADCRWIAVEIGTSVDQVNLALSRLLRLRLLEMAPSGKWRNLMGRGQPTEAQFKKLALIRIRELAAGDGIRLRRPAIT